MGTEQHNHNPACALPQPCDECSGSLQKNVNVNPDSITIGNSKVGEIKVYFDAKNPDEIEEKLGNAISALLKHRKEVLGD